MGLVGERDAYARPGVARLPPDPAMPRLRTLDHRGRAPCGTHHARQGRVTMLDATPTLTPAEIVELVAQIHEAQREADLAAEDRARDASVDAALLDVARARKALEVAMQAEEEASRKYTERVVLAHERERELRARILAGWPDWSTKSIGRATITTRRSVALAPDAMPLDVVHALHDLLGPGAAAKVVTGVSLDDKHLLPLFNLYGDALARVLRVDERRSLTIRKPGEE